VDGALSAGTNDEESKAGDRGTSARFLVRRMTVAAWAILLELGALRMDAAVLRR
jgi:hypothetical protein